MVVENIIIICDKNDYEKIKSEGCLISGRPYLTCDGDCKFCRYSIKYEHVQIVVN